ncbi:Pantetheinase [Halotydeus destructor]|nr:Pantetheinase [Halotydeus destructor]
MMEDIPDVTEINPNPCTNRTFDNRPILQRLSCMARNNRMYVVAQMGDIKECSNATDTNCPEDGFYMYNTAVAFGNDGKLLAKYHKYHLFAEPMYNQPELEFAYFDTPFGRFGLSICFDLVWKEPSTSLVEKYKIDTLVFPTFWFDQLPFGAAHQSQQSWALRHKGRAIVTEHSVTPSYPRLLVASLPVRHAYVNSSYCAPNVVTKQFNYTKDVGQYQDFSPIPIQFYTNAKLRNVSDEIEACDNGVCCKLNYTIEGDNQSQLLNYYLIVGNRTHPGPYKWCEEFCGIVAYNVSSDSYSMTEAAIFQSLKLEANFSTNYVFSSPLANNYELVPIEEWTTQVSEAGHHQLTMATNSPITSAGLYGRCYDRDPVN